MRRIFPIKFMSESTDTINLPIKRISILFSVFFCGKIQGGLSIFLLRKAYPNLCDAIYNLYPDSPNFVRVGFYREGVDSV